MAEANKYGDIVDGKVVRKPFLDFPEKEIGELRGTEEETFTYFTERFALAEQQVADVKAKLEAAENKGSYFMKVVHLKDTLHEMAALGDFESLYAELDQLYDQLKAVIDANRHKNLQIKTALLEELKPIAESHEWKTASKAVKEIQQKWTKTGAVADDKKESIEGEFKRLIDQFYERRASFYADLEQMMVEKEENFKEFLKKAESLKKCTDENDLKKQIAASIDEWKQLGKIKPDRHSKYWDDFQKVIQQARKAVRSASKSKPKDTTAIKKLKEGLLAELEKANGDLVPTLETSQYQQKWKNSGSLGKDGKPLEEKFRFLSASISEKQFLDSLLKKKLSKGASENDRERLRQKLLRDLLNRDVRELQTFEENLDKFNMAKGLDTLLERKHEHQKLKVAVKKAILAELKRDYIVLICLNSSILEQLNYLHFSV